MISIKGLRFVSSLALVAVSLFSAPDAAPLPLSFERSYRNHAWLYRNDGCLVDEQRHLYTYDMTRPEPLKNIGRISANDYQKALSLLWGMKKAPFQEGSIAFDAGILVWRGYFDGEPFDVKTLGDRSGRRDSPSVADLVELINSWCPEELLPHIPEQ